MKFIDPKRALMCAFLAFPWWVSLASGQGSPAPTYCGPYYPGPQHCEGSRDSRELMHHPVFDRTTQSKLLGRSVYLSLTTSPERIQHVWKVLKSLNLSLVTEVLLALPERFSRTGETYAIPEELKWMRSPPVRVLQEPTDLGPIMKLVPAIEYAQRTDPNAIVITVDDDIAYAPGLIEEMLFQLVDNPGTVFSGSLPWISDWGISFDQWPFADQDSGSVVEGWAGVGYHALDVDPALLRRLALLSRETFVSDDIVISYALGLRGKGKRRLFLNWEGPYRLLEHGLGTDALHRGAGLAPGKARQVPDINRWKYTEAVEALNRHLCELKAS